MRERIRLAEVLVVEGKYDAAALSSLVDGLILTTDGFSIFTDEEQKDLIRQLGRQRGLILLTDSDAAGFKIRHYVEQIAHGCVIKHAYIPAVPGKEKRKTTPSKEGTLGVEGMPAELLHRALQEAGAGVLTPREGEGITYTDLYELGLSGGAGSAERRRAFLARVGLPQRLSKRALCQVLSSLYTREELIRMMEDKPVLFWDFHGTLSHPDVLWFDAAREAAGEQVPEQPLAEEDLVENLSRSCLPWWTVPGGDTRHLAGTEAWWGYCEGQFAEMYQKCGFSEVQARKAAPHLRAKLLEAHRYSLYPDAIPTLRELQKRGYRSFILSNNYPELEGVTTALGLAPYVEGVIVSGEVGYDKPHPEIFALARRRAGEPAECWMIGDSVRDDIEGGKAAGFTTVLVHGGCSGSADYSLENLRDLLDILR